MSKKQRTKIIIEGAPIRKPKKPRGLGSGFHKNDKDKRKQQKLDKEIEET